MNNYSDSLAVIVTEWAASQVLDVEVFYSDLDTCWVVGTVCGGCGRMYTEELGTAEGKIRRNEALLCLGCDDDASE